MTSKPVLEVGSGHRPHAQADFLLDRYLESREREGELTRDRPLVIGDGHRLPFRDNSFSRIIARQVLEHAEDPVSFVGEMGRVAENVLIETPSPLTETLFRQRSFHRWCIAKESGGLVIWPIDYARKSAYHGDLFEALYEENVFVYLLIRSRPDVFLTIWDGPVPGVRHGSRDELDAKVAELHAKVRGGKRLRQLSDVRTVARAIASERWPGRSARWPLSRMLRYEPLVPHQGSSIPADKGFGSERAPEVTRDAAGRTRHRERGS